MKRILHLIARQYVDFNNVTSVIAVYDYSVPLNDAPHALV